jgi:hypothetical protein
MRVQLGARHGASPEAEGDDVRTDRQPREPVEGRNRRTALTLVGWIALLMVVSLMVIWLRN